MYICIGYVLVGYLAGRLSITGTTSGWLVVMNGQPFQGRDRLKLNVSKHIPEHVHAHLTDEKSDNKEKNTDGFAVIVTHFCQE